MSRSPESSSIFERNPRKTILILLVVAFMATDLIVAYAAGLVLGYPFHDRPIEHRYMRDNPDKNYRKKSEIYHHDLKQNTSSDSAMWGGKKYTVHTDSLGFKSDRVKTTPLTSDSRTILFIGDSFTEGVGVEYDETFVGTIAAALAKNGTHVVNAGVSSYSPIIYWRKTKYLLEDVGLQFQDLVVYLDISDIEDEGKFYRLNEVGAVERLGREDSDPENDAAQKTHWSIKQLLKTKTLFTYFLVSTARNTISGNDDSRQLSTGLARARWTLDPALFDAYGRDGLSRAAENMAKLHDLAAAHGIQLTLAVYPWPDQIVGNDIDSIQVSYWQEWAKSNGVRFLNYFPCFINSDDADSVLKQYFIPGDVHWNARGHELVAENFLRWFKQAGAENEPCCCQ